MSVLTLGRKKQEKLAVKYPGVRAAMDGNTAVIMCERESSDAAGAYPITPSTQMGEYWAEAAAAAAALFEEGQAPDPVEPDDEGEEAESAEASPAPVEEGEQPQS